jgi:hypothetical protein
MLQIKNPVKVLKIIALLFTVFFVLDQFYDHPRWFFGRQFFIDRQEPVHGGDDATYYFLGEHFWGLGHDPTLVKIYKGYAEILAVYPIRGIGLGTFVLPFQRNLGDRWRPVYSNFVIFINIIGFTVLAFGLASFGGAPLLLAPVFAFLIDRYSLYITNPTSYCTEALTRGFIPIFLGLFFLLSNIKLKKGFFITLSVLYGLVGIILVAMKVQWILGLFLMGIPLLFVKNTRKVGYVTLIVFVLSLLMVRAINYFSFGNKELFAGSGIYALGWSAEGPDLIRIGCEEHRFPESLEHVVCSNTHKTVWKALLVADAPAQDKARVLEIFSEINFELTKKNIPDRIMRLFKHGRMILKEMYFTLQIVTFKKSVFLVILGLFSICGLIIMSLERSVQIISVVGFLFGSIILPSISVDIVVYRYLVPVRSLFYLIPILVVIAALVEKGEKLIKPGAMWVRDQIFKGWEYIQGKIKG